MGKGPGFAAVRISLGEKMAIPTLSTSHPMAGRRAWILQAELLLSTATSSLEGNTPGTYMAARRGVTKQASGISAATLPAAGWACFQAAAR